MCMRLCITVRFLQPYYHGRGDSGRPEWPPSPLRLFQALVAAAAARSNERSRLNGSVPALRWFQQLPLPEIVAPTARESQTGYRSYVPDNVGDLIARSWCRGGNAEIADIRVEKDVRPMHLDGEAVHYLYSVDDERSHLDFVKKSAQSLTHLGWGIDMIVGNADLISEEESSKLKGTRWVPATGDAGVPLRAPLADGTLEELINKHEAFLNRLARDTQGNEFFNPVPPLSMFRTVNYCRATDPEPRCWAAFTLLKPDASSRRSFDTPRRTRDVAGMVRHAIAEVAEKQGWPNDEINVFVHGKTTDGARPSGGTKTPDRFSYLPLPTINPKLNRVESIRRVLVTAPAHCTDRINWLRRALAGAELVDDRSTPQALLTILPSSDWVVRQYYEPSTTWSTVTPIILPIHDGYDPESAGHWLGIAFEQAGFARESVVESDVEWQRIGFRAGVDLVSRYRPPKNLENKPRYHVRVRFPHAVPGPIAVGSGRFRGFGLFASENNEE